MRLTRVYWENKDGTLLELSEMTDSHIHNCIAKIEKSIKLGHPWRKEALPYLRAELKDREHSVNADYYEMINSQYDSDESWD